VRRIITALLAVVSASAVLAGLPASASAAAASGAPIEAQGAKRVDEYISATGHVPSGLDLFNVAVNPAYRALDKCTGGVTKGNAVSCAGAVAETVGTAVAVEQAGNAAVSVARSGLAALSRTAPEDAGEIVGRYADMPSPRPEGMEAHHGVNSVWARANVEGYSAGDAPAALMEADPAHNATRGVFNSWRAEIAGRQGVSISEIDWGAVSPGEAWRLAEEQFQAAGTSPGAVGRYFTQWNDYLDKLGWSNR